MRGFDSALKERVRRGEIAIFRVECKAAKVSCTQYLDGAEVRDLLAETNSERLSDLLALYNGSGIDIDEDHYSLIAGTPLISYLIQETAIFIRESVLENPEVDGQRVEKFLEQGGLANDLR